MRHLPIQANRLLLAQLLLRRHLPPDALDHAVQEHPPLSKAFAVSGVGEGLALRGKHLVLPHGKVVLF